MADREWEASLRRLTVAENTGMGDAERMSDLDAVCAAARQAGADRFLSELPGRCAEVFALQARASVEASINEGDRRPGPSGPGLARATTR